MNDSLVISKMAVASAFGADCKKNNNFSPVSSNSLFQSSVISFRSVLEAWNSFPTFDSSSSSSSFSQLQTPPKENQQHQQQPLFVSEFNQNCQVISSFLNRFLMTISSSSSSSSSVTASSNNNLKLEKAELLVKQTQLANVVFQIIVSMCKHVNPQVILHENISACCSSNSCALKHLFAALLQFSSSCSSHSQEGNDNELKNETEKEENNATASSSSSSSSRSPSSQGMNAIVSILQRHLHTASFGARLTAEGLMTTFSSRFLFNSCQKLSYYYDVDSFYNQQQQEEGAEGKQSTCGTFQIFVGLENILQEAVSSLSSASSSPSSPNQNLHFVIQCFDSMCRHPGFIQQQQQQRQRQQQEKDSYSFFEEEDDDEDYPREQEGSFLATSASQVIPIIAKEGNLARVSSLVDFVSRAQEILKKEYKNNEGSQKRNRKMKHKQQEEGEGEEEKNNKNSNSHLLPSYSKAEVDYLVLEAKRQSRTEEKTLRAILSEYVERNSQLTNELNTLQKQHHKQQQQQAH